MPVQGDGKQRGWIAPDADREMGRVGRRLAARTLVLLAGVMAAVWLLYSFVPASRQQTGPVGFAAALLILLPVVGWIRGVYRTLLQVGRRLVEEERDEEAVRALEPFTRFGNRSFDTDGEAHYLLAAAYARLGQQDQARAAAQFVVRHRASSRWKEPAERLLAERPRRRR